MNLLPESTYLGKLNITEVYEAYDEPCLFACQNASGQIFLTVLIDETEDYKEWLYSSLSQKRFEYMRSGGIDLHDSFKLAENGFVYNVKVPFFEDERSEVSIIPCEELSENMLPLAGEFVKLETQTLPVLSTEDLKQTALSTWREILRFKVEIPGYSRNEAPIKLWGNMLSSFQGVIESIGYQLGREAIKSGAIRKIISQQTELLATGTSGGSYSVDLVSYTSADILRNSLVGESLDIFFKLINATASINNLKPINLENENNENISDIDLRATKLNGIVNDLGRQFASKYRAFLTSVANAESDIKFDWGSPHPERGGSAKLTYIDAINILYLISKMEIAAPEIREVVGVLVGGNIESKRFELRDIYEETKYKGEISDSLFSDDIEMVLEEIYKATMEETIEVNKATMEAKPKYKLIGLERLKLATADNETTDV